MSSRSRLAWVVASLSLAGCGGSASVGPIVYRPSERYATDLKDKPKLQEAVSRALDDLFGPSLQEIKVPADSGFPEGGRRLANAERSGDAVIPVLLRDERTDRAEPIAGGYALYRKYCLHCHGLQGAGDGPTSTYLFPRPRDYRPGVYKFTSTAPSNPKPTREDFRKTLRYGLHGTSMPAFEALMTPAEIDQVIDYVIFLSMRGEVEKNLIDEAKGGDKDDPTTLDAEIIKELSTTVLNNWKAVEELVVSPKAGRVSPTRESVVRGREIYLGINTKGQHAACTDCHGVQGLGNGASFVDRKLFDKVAFNGRTIEVAIAERYREQADEQRAAALAARPRGSREEPARPRVEPFEDYQKRLLTAWKPGSLDDWGNPLRPANLNLGVYKGGRRPIDLYWRIAKGINGAKMPSHASLLTDEQIWDVVNFVLALPYDPALLKDAEALKSRGLAAVSPSAALPR